MLFDHNSIPVRVAQIFVGQISAPSTTSVLSPSMCFWSFDYHYLSVSSNNSPILEVRNWRKMQRLSCHKLWQEGVEDSKLQIKWCDFHHPTVTMRANFSCSDGGPSFIPSLPFKRSLSVISCLLHPKTLTISFHRITDLIYLFWTIFTSCYILNLSHLNK